MAAWTRGMLWLLLAAGLLMPLARPMPVAAVPLATPSPAASPPPAGVAPAGTTGTPVRCRIGAAMVRVRNININADSFDAEFWLWSVCPSGQVEPLKTIDFINESKVSLSLPSHIAEPDGAVWDSVKVIGTFDHDWNFVDYPFDEQELEIQFEDSNNDASALAYVPDQAGSTYKSNLLPPGWRVDSYRLSSDIDTYPTTYGDPQATTQSSQYSRMTIATTISRTSYSSFVKLTFVVYIAFFMALVSYFLNFESATLLTARLSVISGALFAVAVNLRTATTTLGSEEGLTMVDMIHVAALVALLIDAVAALVSQLLVERGRSMAVVYRFDRIVMALVVIGFLVANVVLILWAAHGG